MNALPLKIKTRNKWDERAARRFIRGVDHVGSQAGRQDKHQSDGEAQEERRQQANANPGGSQQQTSYASHAGCLLYYQER